MQYKSKIYEMIHQNAIANFKSGVISKYEMERIDKMCFAKVPKASSTTEKFPKTEYPSVSR